MTYTTDIVNSFGQNRVWRKREGSDRDAWTREKRARENDENGVKGSRAGGGSVKLVACEWERKKRGMEGWVGGERNMDGVGSMRTTGDQQGEREIFSISCLFRIHNGRRRTMLWCLPLTWLNSGKGTRLYNSRCVWIPLLFCFFAILDYSKKRR